MARILMDFAALEANLALCGRGRKRNQYGDLVAPTDRQHPQGADAIIELIGHLQHPFHAAKSRRGTASAPCVPSQPCHAGRDGVR